MKKYLLLTLALLLCTSLFSCDFNFNEELVFGDPEVPSADIDKPVGEVTQIPFEELTDKATAPIPPLEYGYGEYDASLLQGARFESEVVIHNGTLTIPNTASDGGDILKVDFSFMSSRIPQYLTKESFEEIYGKIENDSSISQVDKMTFSNFFKLYDLDMLDSFPAEQKDSFAKAWSEKYPIIDKTPVYVFSGTTDVEADMVDKLLGKVGVSLEDRAAHIDSLKGYCTEPDEIIFGNNMVYPLDASEVSNVEIPDGVESIRLSGMQNVKEITLPESVKRIEKMAFAYSTSLEKIYIPAGVSSISADAFYECPALAEITFGGTEAQWAQLAAAQKLYEACTVTSLGDATE